MINRNKQQSFTLIELLVVIVIIGILAGVIMISTSSSIDKANFAKLKVFSESVKNNLMLNLVSEWDFDNITQYNLSTGVIDIDAKISDSWGRNDGVAKNQPILKKKNECVSGECVFFNGINNYIYILKIAEMDLATKMTVESWINLEGPSDDYQCIISDSWIKWYLGFAPNGKTLFASTRNTAGSGAVGGNYVLDSYKTWYHIVMIVDESRGLSIYLNGIEKFKNLTPFLFRKTSSNIEIGSDGTVVGMDYFHGMIDEVRLYSDALSSSQIKQNYIAGLNSMLSNGNISKQEYNERISGLAEINY